MNIIQNHRDGPQEEEKTESRTMNQLDDSNRHLMIEVNDEPTLQANHVEMTPLNLMNPTGVAVGVPGNPAES